MLNKTSNMELAARSLRSLGSLLNDRIRDFEQQTGIAPLQFEILCQLDNNSVMTISELSSATGVSQPVISKNVDKLEAQSWLERQRKLSDKRVVDVHLTPSGRAQFAAMHDPYQALVRQAIARLADHQDRQKVYEALTVLDNALAGGEDEVANDMHRSTYLSESS